MKIVIRAARLCVLYLITFVVLSYGIVFFTIFENRDKVCYLSLWPPAAIIYTDDVISPVARKLYPEEAKRVEDAQATTSLVIIRIKKEHFGDQCVIEHEMEHVRQYMWSLGTNGVMARLSDDYILEREIGAFKVQIQCLGNDEKYKMAAAEALSCNYGLNISYREAYKRLSE